MKKELSYNENEKKSLDLKGFVCDINSLEINNSTWQNWVSESWSSKFWNEFLILFCYNHRIRLGLFLLVIFQLF